jgi:multidrug efflux pump subunit AcrA (membrane-fusion protein)
VSIVDEIPPQRSADLTFSPKDRDGHHFIRNNRTRTYLRLGAVELFLLENLDGERTYGGIAGAFEQEFNEPITVDEIREFVALAEKEGLLGNRKKSRSVKPFSLHRILRRTVRQIKKQSPLYFRVKLVDPNSFLNWLEPKTRFVFSTWLAVAASLGLILALSIVWCHRVEFVQTVKAEFGWNALMMFWITSIFVTVLHEFGHGLACKKYGGDVHEMGALWIFFTPCLYCNVSDAWMLPGRWRRFLISMAGTYIDLLIWIPAVMAWRLTSPGSLVHFFAWIVVSGCGLRLAFNLNPLMRLDGYYALSDLLRLPNLRIRGRERLMEFTRSIFWGGPWPKPIPSGKTLLTYGIASWVFAVGLLGALSFQISAWLQSFMGLGGVLIAGTFFFAVTKSFFRGSLGEEFQEMFKKRLGRVALAVALLAGAMVIPITNRVGGEFLVKPVVHWEVCTPVAGFLREVHVADGQQVAPGSVVAVIEVPELSNQISRKLAEIAEVKAELRRLKTGARVEDIHEQTEKIKRAVAWCELGKTNLAKARDALAQELKTLDLRIEQAQKEYDYRQKIFEQAQALFNKGGMAEQQLLYQQRLADEAGVELKVARSQKMTRIAAGVIDVETELARREKELADERAKLALLEAGSRVEDIEAVQARSNRLHEEMRILEEQEQKQTIVCPVGGTNVTARIRDRIGQFFERGVVIFIVEDLDRLEAELAIPEQYVESVIPGQAIKLKPKLLPSLTLDGTVMRIAPSVNNSQLAASTTVTVYCRFNNDRQLMRAGMTGYGRIQLGKSNVGQWLFDRGKRLLRTEFWW